MSTYEKPCQTLVVDSGSLIKKVDLNRLADKLVTVEVRTPTAEALQKIVQFSKLTVDMLILALTYQLTRELEPTTELRSQPVGTVRVAVKGKGGPTLVQPESLSLAEDNATAEKADALANEDLAFSEPKEETSDAAKEKPEQASDSQPSEQVQEAQESSSDEEEEGEGEEGEDEPVLQVKSELVGWGSEWITPESLSKAKAAVAFAGDVRQVAVAITTTDYSMQNVLLQMGLHLVSVDGLMVRAVKQFVLRCDSCMNIVRSMEKKFCPKCGLATLGKVHVEIDSEGRITHIHNPLRKSQKRGQRYNIPLPKGGRNNHDLVLAPDEYEEKISKNRKKKTADPFDINYQFGGKTGPQTDVQVGYGRKNPNISRRKVGKKNKTRLQHL